MISGLITRGLMPGGDSLFLNQQTSGVHPVVLCLEKGFLEVPLLYITMSISVIVWILLKQPPLVQYPECNFPVISKRNNLTAEFPVFCLLRSFHPSPFLDVP